MSGRDEGLINDILLHGFLRFDGLFTSQECDEFLEGAYNFTKNLPPPEERTEFTSNDYDKGDLVATKYFIESNDKIRCFFEEEALDEKGELKVEPQRSLNKVGHALHLLDKVFHCYTYCGRVKSICHRLGFKEPAVIMSMVHYRNPGLGGEVKPHQDITYFRTEPVLPIAFWIALEDVTKENGCLWVAPGSHRSGMHRSLIRNPDPYGKQLIYDKPERNYPKSNFIPVEMKKGSCVVLHGNLVYKCTQNISDKARPAYIFHVAEKHKNYFATNNWIREGKNAPFLNMYETLSYLGKNRSALINKSEEDPQDPQDPEVPIDPKDPIEPKDPIDPTVSTDPTDSKDPIGCKDPLIPKIL